LAGEDDTKKGSVDSSDLKARLGLKRRQRRAPAVAPPAPAAPAVGGAAAPPAQPAGPSQADIEEARRRAEEALAEAGPAAESFGLMGEERTPVPVQSSGPEYVVVEGAESFAGQNKGKLIPLVAGALFAVTVAFFLGRTCGMAVSDQETYQHYITEAKEKLDFFEQAQTKSGDKVLDRVLTMKEELAGLAKQVGGVIETAKDDQDYLKLEPILTKFLPKLRKYRDDGVFFNAVKLLDGMIYNYDVIAAAAQFALKTQLMHERITAAFNEASNYAPLARPRGPTMRMIYVGQDDKEIKLPKWTIFQGNKPVEKTECKLPADCPRGFTCKESKCAAKFKVAKAQWLSEVGTPGLVEKPSPDPKQPPIQEWQMVVRPEGSKDVMQVPTTSVMQLDLAKTFDAQQLAVRALTAKRLALISLDLAQVAGSVNWDKVHDVLKSCSENKGCSFKKAGE